MKVEVVRSTNVVVKRTIEVAGHNLVTPCCAHDSMWRALRKKCRACGLTFEQGDSISIAMYVEDGKEYSGGFHTTCLESRGE